MERKKSKWETTVSRQVYLRWAFDVYTRVLSNSEIEQRGLGDLKGAKDDGVGVDGIEELGRREGNEDGWMVGKVGVFFWRMGFCGLEMDGYSV